MSNVEKQDITDLPEILNAFEQALELERELGTRAVDCDRALLLPVSAKELNGLNDVKDLKDVKDVKDLKDPKDLKDLSDLLPMGNLTPDERQILQAACTEKNN